jgi:hypothetical protein
VSAAPAAAATAAELAREGWERRAAVSPERVFEHVLLYNELGYEVRVERADPAENPGGCSACIRPESPDRVLYIRREQ